MARVIYKYPFSEDSIYAGIDYIDLPRGNVLLVAQQGENRLPTIWVEHEYSDEEAAGHPVLSPNLERYRIAGTGNPIPDEFGNWVHVGSCICGAFVWHVYKFPYG